MSKRLIQQTHKPKFLQGRHRKVAVQTPEQSAESAYRGRMPRVTRLMALAVRFEHLLNKKMVTNQTELAELTHVTKPRITQLMNLLHLAPDIQEEILFLPGITEGKDPICETDIRPITREDYWPIQRQMWAAVKMSSL